MGHSPQFYFENKSSKNTLNYWDLLHPFGDEINETIYSNDQVPEQCYSLRSRLVDDEILRTLNSCHHTLTECNRTFKSYPSKLHPSNCMVSSTLYLGLTSFLGAILKPIMYNDIKLRLTSLNYNILDIFWPSLRRSCIRHYLEEDINCGIFAPDEDIYVMFQEFMNPVLKEIHGLKSTYIFRPHPRMAYFPIKNANCLPFTSFMFADQFQIIRCCQIECSRNICNVALPLNLDKLEVEKIERLIISKLFTRTFNQILHETNAGNYYTVAEILDPASNMRKLLEDHQLMIPLLDGNDSRQKVKNFLLNGRIWPYGRGVYITFSLKVALWINCQEHLRIIISTANTNPKSIGSIYTQLAHIIDYLDKEFHFKESSLLGYLQSRPAYLGTGLKFTTTLQLVNLIKEIDNLLHLCVARGLHLETRDMYDNYVKLINMQSLAIVEHKLFIEYYAAVTNIIDLESSMTLSNSKHIANMLVKIFGDDVITKSLQDLSIFEKEDGKYLTIALADPLIKALTDISQNRPADPIAFLISFLQNYNPRKCNTPVHCKTNETLQQNSAMGQPNTTDYQTFNINTRNDGLTSETAVSPLTHMDERDEHGQSVLHFACARSHRRGRLMHLIKVSNMDITYRDELYRTARDVSFQANQTGNAEEIDNYVFMLAASGDLPFFQHLAMQGYDHMLDIFDSEERSITDIASEKGHTELTNFLKKFRSLEELREELHEMIRRNNKKRITEIISDKSAKWLLKAKNYYGRSALHIAVLKEVDEILECFVRTCPEALEIGDNLERTVLHYAMGTNEIECLSRILIQNGAKRTAKDLKGRQPSYYFMNKADILRLQEEEFGNR